MKLSYRHRWKLRSDILRGDWRMKKPFLKFEVINALRKTLPLSPPITSTLFRAQTPLFITDFQRGVAWLLDIGDPAIAC